MLWCRGLYWNAPIMVISLWGILFTILHFIATSISLVTIICTMPPSTAVRAPVIKAAIFIFAFILVILPATTVSPVTSHILPCWINTIATGTLWQRVSHRNVPHLIICFSPAPLRVFSHKLLKNKVIICYIVPNVGICCSVNDKYILPNFSRLMWFCFWVYSSIDSEGLLPPPNSIYTPGFLFSSGKKHFTFPMDQFYSLVITTPLYKTVALWE